MIFVIRVSSNMQLIVKLVFCPNIFQNNDFIYYFKNFKNKCDNIFLTNNISRITHTFSSYCYF